MSLLAPNGSAVDTWYGNAFRDTVTLSEVGTYTVKIDPVGSTTGAMTIKGWSVAADRQPRHDQPQRHRGQRRNDAWPERHHDVHRLDRRQDHVPDERLDLQPDPSGQADPLDDQGLELVRQQADERAHASGQRHLHHHDRSARFAARARSS